MDPRLVELTRRAAPPIRREFAGVLVFLAVIWAAFAADLVLPTGRELRDYLALIPRDVRGFAGIFTMHLLHRDWSHILGNTFPLVVLLTLMAGSRANTKRMVLAIMLISGSVLWLVGAAGARYIGASVLVFGLIGFLVTAGILERRPVSMIISLVVGVMYGWTFLMGIIPLNSQTSELSHFIGGVTGVALAVISSSRLTRRPSADADAVANLTRR